MNHSAVDTRELQDIRREIAALRKEVAALNERHPEWSRDARSGVDIILRDGIVRAMAMRQVDRKLTALENRIAEIEARRGPAAPLN